MNATDLPTGTRIYTTGDMANASGFGTVTASGDLLHIAMDDGRTLKVPAFAFSPKFNGTCATRLVTEAAYRAFRAARAA